MPLKSQPIEIRNFNVWYGEHTALKDITVSIPPRAITAIIGPSGCGKTTLLRSLNRLVENQQGVRVKGEVILNGENIYDPKINLITLRQKMGLLSQRPTPLPMSIYSNIAFGMRLHSSMKKEEEQKKVRHYLEMANLYEEVKDRLKEPAIKLSIGQQQRLCLARGLAVEPLVLLCDEPTSALDPVSSQWIEKIFLGLKKDYTVIMVTHILRQAIRLADYVIFMYMGEVVEHGPAQEMFYNPKQEKTKEYMKGIIS